MDYNNIRSSLVFSKIKHYSPNDTDCSRKKKTVELEWKCLSGFSTE